jgi:hypothetical protein
MAKRLIASSLAASFAFGAAFGLALSSATTQKEATTLRTDSEQNNV